jgi:large subunit ribosomal protein L18
MKRNIDSRKIRHKRLRAKIRGTSKRPRLSVFRSNKFVYAQIIDDEKGKILFSANDSKKKKGAKIESAKIVGKEIAKKAAEGKIKKIIFDRGGYKYHGRIKSLAEGAREGGLEF